MKERGRECERDAHTHALVRVGGACYGVGFLGWVGGSSFVKREKERDTQKNVLGRFGLSASALSRGGHTACAPLRVSEEDGFYTARARD